MPPKASSKSAAISLNSSQTQLLCLVIQHGGITQPSKEKWEVIAKALGIVKGDPVNAAYVHIFFQPVLVLLFGLVVGNTMIRGGAGFVQLFSGLQP